MRITLITFTFLLGYSCFAQHNMNNTVLIDTMEFQQLWASRETFKGGSIIFTDSSQPGPSAVISFYAENKVECDAVGNTLCGEDWHQFNLNYQVRGNIVYFTDYMQKTRVYFPSAWEFTWLDEHSFKMEQLFFLVSVYDDFVNYTYADTLDKYWVSETLDFPDGSSIVPHWKITSDQYFLMAEKDTLLALRHVDDPETMEAEIFSTTGNYTEPLYKLGFMPRMAEKNDWQLKMPPKVYFTFNEHGIYLECTTTADQPGEQPFYLQFYINPIPLNNLSKD